MEISETDTTVLYKPPHFIKVGLPSTIVKNGSNSSQSNSHETNYLCFKMISLGLRDLPSYCFHFYEKYHLFCFQETTHSSKHVLLINTCDKNY